MLTPRIRLLVTTCAAWSLHIFQLQFDMGDAIIFFLLFLAACSVYWNALSCGFVFDDVSAIKENKDLRPRTPLWNLFLNDFWGTPMVAERSHKSYRPLTVLTFRINYAIGELNPFGYHFANILLHGIVTVLFYRLVRRHLVPVNEKETAIVAALLFAWHPIHVEAVTGVVGRAELLAAIAFLQTLMAYIRCTRFARASWKHWCWLGVACVWTALGTLCKEQAVTVVGVCFVHEVMLVHKMTFRKLATLAGMLCGGHSSSGSTGNRSRHSERWNVLLQLRLTILRCLALLAFLACLLYTRIKVMGAKLPIFTNFDNPAAHAASPIRQLTFNYLLPINVWLLIFPRDLCCDWTMGTVPLISGWTDPRNLFTVLFYVVCGALGFYSLKEKGDRPKVVGLALAISIISFLPASNLFFPVGFVVAERILYTPSMGFCILLAVGFKVATDRYPRGARILIGLILILYSARTIHRNFDWKNEYTLFNSGLKVTTRNAKLWNNVGHALEGENRFADALSYFQQASQVQPDDIGAHINVGRTQVNLGNFDAAEEAYKKALSYFPQPIKGTRYTSRLAPSHLKVFINLSNLLIKNASRLEEADAYLQRAISMRADFVEAYQNRGDILLRLGRPLEAKAVYDAALQYQPMNADLHYNLGVVLMELGDRQGAYNAFSRSINYNPEHEHALYNSAVFLSDSPSTSLEGKLEAKRRFMRVLAINPAHAQAHFSLAMLETDFKNFFEAERHYLLALKKDGTSRSSLFNIALLYYNELKRAKESLSFVKTLLKHHPTHVKGHLLAGDIYLNSMKNTELAEDAFRRAHELEPNNVQALHNLCVVLVTKGDLKAAHKCLTHAMTMAPNDTTIRDHLTIVQQRMKGKP